MDIYVGKKHRVKGVTEKETDSGTSNGPQQRVAIPRSTDIKKKPLEKHQNGEVLLGVAQETQAEIRITLQRSINSDH